MTIVVRPTELKSNDKMLTRFAADIISHPCKCNRLPPSPCSKSHTLFAGKFCRFTAKTRFHFFLLCRQIDNFLGTGTERAPSDIFFFRLFLAREHSRVRAIREEETSSMLFSTVLTPAWHTFLSNLRFKLNCHRYLGCILRLAAVVFPTENDRVCFSAEST